MADIETGARPAVATGANPSSYVEWGAVLAGAFTALAVAFVLLTFGGAVGLAAVSPWTSTSGTVKAVTLGSAFWLLLVHVWAFALGGYLSGRMRQRWAGATADESAFRDGAHGVLVWAVAVTFGAVVAASTAASIARGTANAAGSLAGSAVSTAQSIAVDQMLRTPNPAANTQGGEVRAEVGRIVANSLQAGELTAADKTYLAEVVANRTGIAPPEAEKRVQQAIDTAKAAIDKARKTGVVVGFLIAATLLIAAGAAWWGAGVGGRHRNEGTLWAGFMRHERSL